MSEKGVALRYARAIISCVDSESDLDILGNELAAFAQVYETDPNLKKTLNHPGIPRERRERVLSGILDAMEVSDLCRRVLTMVFGRGRIDIIHDITERFGVMADEKLKRVQVNIASAHPLTDDENDRLRETFSRLEGKTAKLETRVDPSLIGGLVAHVGSRVYDGSVSNQIRLMRLKLEQEA